MIEIGYTFLAAIVVGAIVGGLTGKLVLPKEEAETVPQHRSTAGVGSIVSP
jgi:hypothetical protein